MTASGRTKRTHRTDTTDSSHSFHRVGSKGAGALDERDEVSTTASTASEEHSESQPSSAPGAFRLFVVTVPESTTEPFCVSPIPPLAHTHHPAPSQYPRTQTNIEGEQSEMPMRASRTSQAIPQECALLLPQNTLPSQRPSQSATSGSAGASESAMARRPRFRWSRRPASSPQRRTPRRGHPSRPPEMQRPQTVR
mgnify:CR=1 FL=1